MKQFRDLVEDAVPVNTVGATPPASIDNTVVLPKKKFKTITRGMKMSGIGYGDVGASNVSGGDGGAISEGINVDHSTSVEHLRGREEEHYGKPLHEVDKEVASIIPTMDNHARANAVKYSQEELGRPFEHVSHVEKSSHGKQKAIADAYDMAVHDSPEYKDRVFKAYQEQRPDIIKETGATDYHSLVQNSYKALEHHVNKQYDTLPVKVSTFENFGEGKDYMHSGEMLRDVFKHGNVNIFKGGDKHEFLNKEDPITGLNSNEKFRAVHDYYGHAIHGNSFGANGEEIAWDTHKSLLPVAAHVALTSETRGQNSWVNYSGANDEHKAKISANTAERKAMLAKDPKADVSANIAKGKEIGNNWNYAEQRSIALPPEMLHTHFDGKMPEYLKGVPTVGNKIHESFKNLVEGEVGSRGSKSRPTGRRHGAYFDDEDSGYHEAFGSKQGYIDALTNNGIGGGDVSGGGDGGGGE